MKIPLKVGQEVRRRHSATCEEVSRHPPIIKVVWCTTVAEEVDKELATGLQGRRNLGHEHFIVLHMFEELYLDS